MCVRVTCQKHLLRWTSMKCHRDPATLPHFHCLHFRVDSLMNLMKVGFYKTQEDQTLVLASLSSSPLYPGIKLNWKTYMSKLQIDLPPGHFMPVIRIMFTSTFHQKGGVNLGSPRSTWNALTWAPVTIQHIYSTHQLHQKSHHIPPNSKKKPLHEKDLCTCWPRP